MLLREGKGELIGWRDPDENRQFVRENKSRVLIDKQMSIQEAVARFVRDGDFLASGGFGHVRVSMNAIYEIIRQKKKNLIMAGKTAVHDLDLLVTAGCVDRVEAAYCFGHELRGLSPGSRRKIESGQCRVMAETSNAGFQFRFLAAMMGVPFVPARNMMGTDTFEHSSAKVIEDPYSGKPVCLMPAAYPDVAIIHVNRCDIYGNAQIDIIIMRQDKTKFVNRLDFLTTPGYLSGPGAREEAGLPSGGGPYRVITQLAVYGYDEDIKEMKLISLHPGVTVDDVQNNSSFEILVPEGEIPVTRTPAAEELDLLRSLDPAGISLK